RIGDEDDRFVTAQGVAIDLERNYAVTMEASRRIPGRTGRRFNDDMISTTKNAANAIAWRQAIFKIVLQTVVRELMDQAQAVSLGKGLSTEQRRGKALEWFQKIGIPRDLVCKLCGVGAELQIGTEQLVILRGIRTAAQDGDVNGENLIQEAAG